MTSIESSKPQNMQHLLIYPLSGSGHIIPFLDLTHLLLRRGFTITVVISAANLHLLHPLLSSHPTSLHHLLFQDPAVNPSSHPLIGKIIASQKHFDPIVRWFQSQPSPPVAIVSDFFLGWTAGLASHLGIRRVVFSPSGALGSSILQTVWRDVPEINAGDVAGGVSGGIAGDVAGGITGDVAGGITGDVAGDDSSVLSFPEIPNSPEFPRWQLSHLIRLYKKGDSDFESFRNGILANMTSWGIVYNTFEELEGVYIDYMKKQMGHDRVWAVGPLLPDDHGPISPTGRGGVSVVLPDDLLVWLDEKGDDSVAYICFGSRTVLSEKQMSALAGALELSGVNFILCEKAGDSSSIPDGFEARVAGRGFVVKGWAPQLAILRHKAVGSFVTHCGWNSTLEGVAAGVMMLTWPMGADQYANAKLLVDQLGIGKRVCEGGPESVPDSVELARLLDESLSDDDNKSERVKVKELSQAAMKAVKEGTSIRDLDMFTKLISEI